MIEMKADGKEIELSHFPGVIIESTFKGALSALRGGENLIGALIRVEDGVARTLTLNGKPAEMNEFISSLLGGIVLAAADALHGTKGATAFEVRIT